jgi:hypothetical protein
VSDVKLPKIELLWWSGCPSWPEAIEQLSATLEEVGADPDAIEVRQVETEEGAEQERFVGSPTIRVDGEDVRPPGPDEPIGLTCRVYHLRDGRVSPVPDRADLKEAIVRAIASHRRSERSRA